MNTKKTVHLPANRRSFEIEIEIEKWLRDWRAQWSIGSFGAIAEFIREPTENCEVHYMQDAWVIKAKSGSLLIKRKPLPSLIPFEIAAKDTWNHRVALCLPDHQARMSERAKLTELGRDNAAIQKQDRNGILFDLGLQVFNTDICIRTSDHNMISILRHNAGKNFFALSGDVLRAIQLKSPNRIFISRIGRIEIYTKIPSPSEKSPLDSHTHILPKLLRHGLTYPKNEPIPSGLLPCAYIYPSHPMKDWCGNSKQFDLADHIKFQALMKKFCDPNLIKIKEKVVDALRAGISIEILQMETRIERNFARVAQLQWKCLQSRRTEKTITSMLPT